LWGHLAFAGSNAREAMNLFEQQEYDLILLDIQMPEVDGVELMQMMRDQRPQLTTPIVAITANLLDEEKERLLRLGFNAYLGKPLEEVKLRNMLEQDPQPIADTRQQDSEQRSNSIAPENESIDFALSLKLSGNNEQLCLDMLKMLQQGIEEYQQQLRQAIDSKSLGKLAYIIHKLQGVTCYTGLPKLKFLLSQYNDLKHLDTEKTLQSCEEIIIELGKIYRILVDTVDLNSVQASAQSIADSA